MSFFSFLRLLGARRLRNSSPARARSPRRKKQGLSLESLERRDVPATPPTIVASGVTPPDGRPTASTHPTIQVQFSESMTSADVGNPANYLLVDSGGNPLAIQSVTV